MLVKMWFQNKTYLMCFLIIIRLSSCVLSQFIITSKMPCVATGNQNVYIAIYIGFNKIITI
jgi:hypothetical protein